MKATYVASTNSIKELPEMEAPDMNKYGGDYFLAYGPIKAYEKHCASLRTIPVSGEHGWKDGQTLEEGKDYKTSLEACAYHYLPVEMYHCQECKIVAIPLKAESEDEKHYGYWQLCPKCEGWGKVIADFWDGPTYVNELVCPVCNGEKVLPRPEIKEGEV